MSRKSGDMTKSSVARKSSITKRENSTRNRNNVEIRVSSVREVIDKQSPATRAYLSGKFRVG